MDPAGGEQTEKTLVRHWQAFAARDVESLMADYAKDAAAHHSRLPTERSCADTVAVREGFCEHLTAQLDLA